MARLDIHRYDSLVNFWRMLPIVCLLCGSTAASAAVASPVPRAASRPFLDLGRAAAATPIRLAVVLNYRRGADLDRFVERLESRAAGPAIRPLTAQEFLNAFAPGAADYAATQIALARLGLRITHTYANRTVIDVTGSAAAVESAFSTRIDNVRHADGSIGYANVTPVSLPAVLQRTVLGVAGFDNSHFKTFNRRGPRRAGKPGPVQGPDTGLGPIAIEKSYDMPVLHGFDGSGQSAAVVIDADYLDKDLSAYLKFFKVTRTGPATVRIPIDGGPPSGLTQDSTETTLDVETIVGTAPGVALYVYEMPQIDSASILDAYNQVNSDDKVGAVNSSFGSCETQTDQANFPRLADKLAEQGQALGIVYAASTGDSGTAECSFGQAPGGVTSPASSPHFVAVGGTTLLLHADGSRITELGWYDSGGGLSAIFKKPPYQQNVPRATGTMRILPDIAFDADPSSGVSTYINGGWFGPTGGTSLSSPIFTAIVTELAQFRNARVGNAHNLLYDRFIAAGYGPKSAPQFYDAIGDSNGYWIATKGFDAVTGIGSMDGWNFLNGGKPPSSVASSPAHTAVVTLKYHHRDELAKLIDASSDPYSPMYGHFLTGEQFRAYFAPTDAEYTATLAALQRAGFAIQRTWDNRTIVDVTLPERSSDQSRVTRLMPFVDKVVVNSRLGEATRRLRGNPRMPSLAAPTNGPDGGYGPNVFTQALNFPTRHGFDGTGTIVADVIDGAPLDADISTFLKTFGIKRTSGKTKVIPVNPGNAPDQDLADIDAEWLVATAPGARQLVYQMPVYDNVDLVDAYTKVVQDNVADVANISLSRCENANVDMALSLVPIFQQGAAQGISFEDISFGGVSGCFVPNRLFPLIPADMADGTAVGAVNAIVNGGKIVALSGMPNSGGGISELFPVPSQQKAVKGVNQSGRNTPDMSVVSEINGSGASLFFENGWNGNFIFTNSAPVASLIAEYKQMTGHRMGAFDRTLYRLFAKSGYANGITDIVGGCNGTLNGEPVCAVPGYDITSGIGSFTNAYALGQRLKR